MINKKLVWNPDLSEPAEEMVYSSFREVSDMWKLHHTASLTSKKINWSIDWKQDITCLLAEVLSEAQ